MGAPSNAEHLQGLLDHGDPTGKQREAVEAVIKHGSHRGAASALGQAQSNIAQHIALLKKKAARKGYAPEHGQTRPAPDGQVIKGVSTLYDDTGKQRLQWVKTNADHQRQLEILKEAVQGLTEAVPPRPARTPPKDTNAALMSLYPCADLHVGMYSWAKETGADFDVDIAYRDTCAAVDYLVERSPPSRRAALLNLGDLWHTENTEGVTEASRNVLDMDTRFSNMFEVGLSVLEYAIARMLERHEHVDLVNIPGNHDRSIALVLPALFHRLYANEPRITVHDNERERVYLEHGRCLIGAIHGDKTKDQELLQIMATEQPEAWGRTRHRYYFRGHHHHDNRVEYNGGVVEQVRTPSAADAYTVGRGYLSGRDLKCIVMHERYGEQSRFTCGIDVLRDVEDAAA